MESIEYANGNYAWYWYDEQNRLIKLTNFAEFEQDPNNPTGDILSSYEYTLAEDGKRLQAVEVQDGTSRTVQWQYDNLSRLTQESVVDGYTDVYEFDLVGNRLSITKDGTPTYYFYDECDLLEKECSDSAGNNVLVEYAYDDNGSLTSRIATEDAETTEVISYTYNLCNRLATVTTTPYIEGVPDTASVMTYAYDPDGNRVQKTISGGDEIDYLIDPYNHTGYEQVLSQAVSDGVNPDEVTFFIIGSDVIGQVTDTDDPLYLLCDGHGSVRQDSDTDGVAQSSYNYDAFGEADGFNPVDGLYYAGEMYDAAIDKYNNRARYYDPPTGRFITSDPFEGNLQDPLSLHKYIYAHANPINAGDPSGLFTIADITAANSIRNIMSDVYLNVFDSVQMSVDASFSSMTLNQLIIYKTAFDVAPFLVAPVFKMFSNFIDDVWPRITRRIASGRAGIRGRRLVGVADILSTQYRKLGAKGTRSVQMVGEVGASFTMRAKGAKCVFVNPGVHGIDQIWQKGNLYYIVEAKGGTGSLAKGQMSKRWISDRIKMVKKVDPEVWKMVDIAKDQGRLKGVVVRTKTKGASAFTPMFVEREWSQIGLNTWSGR